MELKVEPRMAAMQFPQRLTNQLPLTRLQGQPRGVSWTLPAVAMSANLMMGGSMANSG